MHNNVNIILKGIKNMEMISLPYEFIPRHLDVAGGTGDIAFRSVDHMVTAFKSQLHQNVFSQTAKDAKDRQIVVCDINADMLAVGADKAKKLLGVDKAKMVRTYIYCLRALCMVE